jgi:cytochrome c-type biogenesis protein CcmH
MKLGPYFNKFVFISVSLSLLMAVLLNKTISATEDDFKKITSKLRCMTCQNQTIYDSDSDFSKDIKRIVIEKLQNNKSEEEIIHFLIQRYGEYIVFEPQMNKQNIFLWYFPFIILGLSLVFLIFRIRKNN